MSGLQNKTKRKELSTHKQGKDDRPILDHEWKEDYVFPKP